MNPFNKFNQLTEDDLIPFEDDLSEYDSLEDYEEDFFERGESLDDGYDFEDSQEDDFSEAAW